MMLVVVAVFMGIVPALGPATAAATPVFSKNVLDPTVWGGARTVGAVDVDLDGDLDVVGMVGNGSSNVDIRVFSNDGAGNFTKIIDVLGSHTPTGCSVGVCPIQTSQWSNRIVFPGDLSGDGYPDFLTTSSSTSSALIWWKNDLNVYGDFTPVEIETLTTIFGGSTSVLPTFSAIHTLDVDQDGDTDVLAGKLTVTISGTNFGLTGELDWWRNDGGRFSTKLIVDPDDSYSPSVIAKGDMDNDGNSDIVVSLIHEVPTDVGGGVITPVGYPGIYWYRYDGGGTFTRFIVDSNQGASMLRTGDLDGDGDQDIVALTGVSWTDSAVWYRNEGNGTFSRFPLPGTGTGGSGLKIVDLDNDGDQDILIGTDQGIMWARNDGGGIFTPIPVDLTFAEAHEASATRSVDAADLDGDNIVDVMGAAGTNTGSYKQPDGLAWWKQQPVSAGSLPEVSVFTTDSTATESKDGVPNPGGYTITRTGSTAAPLTVNYTMSGSATNGTDYTSLPGSVTIPAGQAFVTLAVTPIDDDLYEVPAETAVLDISTDAAYAVGANHALVTISDDGDSKPVANFVSSGSTVLESSGWVDIPVMFSKPAGIVSAYVGYNAASTLYSYTIKPSSPVPPNPSNPDSLTFYPGDTVQYIRINVTGNASINADHTVTFTLQDYGSSMPFTIGPNKVYTLTILDDDSQRVTVSATDANAAEPGADTGTFTIDRYVGPTTSSLTVNYTLSGTAANGTDYDSLPGSVTIPAGQRTADVVVTPLDDSLMENTETVTLTISADAAYRIDAPSSATVNIADDDVVAGINVTPTAGLMTTEAGGTSAFTVVLASQPTADVTIGLSSSNTAEGTVYPSSLTFTPTNWNVPQPVTVTGVDDALTDGNVTYTIVTAAAVSADANYNGLDAADVTVINQDDDAAGITVTPTTGLVTDETGATDTFTVVLNTAPSFDVTIGLSSSNTAEGTVSPASLTFTSGDWNIPQTVTVTGVDDTVPAADGNVAYTIVTAAAVSSDGAYSGLDADDVAVTNVDDESPGIKVTPLRGLVTTEAGGTATFDVVLYTAPTADVVIDLSSSDTSEGTVSPTSLTFTTGDWSTVQTVTVTGVDDSIADGTVPYSIVTAAATSTDSAYDGLDAGDVAVTNTDDDTVGVTVTPTSGLTTTEAGGTSTFTVKLNSQPTADVTIALSSSDSSEGTVSPSSLTFTGANWNTTQTVTVTGVDDSIADGAIAYTIITAAATSSDSAYNGLDPSDVAVSNSDDDAIGFTFDLNVDQLGTPIDLNTTEGGGTAQFAIRLNSLPTADVTIVLSSSDSSEGTVSPASLTFTTADWNEPHIVTVAGVDDFMDDGDISYSVVTAAASSADSGYNGQDPADVAVVNIDDDTAGITVSPTSDLVTTEVGGTATFNISLTSQPAAGVTINLSSSDTSEGTVSPSLVTLTAADWSSPHPVTVTGVDDPQQDGNIAYSIVTAAASSIDTQYNGLNASDVSVTNIDNDVAGITVTPTSGLITTEAGGTATFTVALDTPPFANVTVDLSSSDTTEGTVSPSSLTFTPVNWSTAQTVTVTGVDDVMIDGNIAYTIVTAPATSSDGFYNGIDPADVSVTNNDDDIVGITVTPFSGLITTENGDTATFSVVLDAAPTADVIIGLSSDDTDEGTVSPSSLTFNSTDWSTAQTVTVTGVDDVAVDGDTAYKIVTAAAVSGDSRYSGLNAYDVAVTNIDNDAASVTVTPTFGLTTSEAGGTASFTMVLSSQPTANVTIGLSSSDTGEGTVSPSSVTFTTANWNLAQTVTVTGVDDSAVDGGAPYVIITAPAVSADSHYSGINVSNVFVINSDDDTPPPVDPSTGLQSYWQKSYDNTHFDEAVDVVVDAAGNVYVTGRSNNGANYDFATVKYDSDGTQKWVARYDGGDSDLPIGLRVDALGNVYVAGRRHNGTDFDYFLVKYDASGGEQWGITPFDSGGEDEPAAMAIDNAGNVYLTGKSCNGGNCNIVTLKYTTGGALDWSAVYNASDDDEGVGIGVDISGNVYVAGRSSNGGNTDIVTIKYNDTGSKLWVTSYNSGNNDYPAAMVVDAAGNSYVAGRISRFPAISDVLVVKYDSSGLRQWSASYSNGLTNLTVAMAVGATGNVYVTSASGRVGDYDYGVVKFNADGSLGWNASYDNGGADDEPVDIAVDNFGRVFVTGSSGSVLAGDRNYVTVAYDSDGTQSKVLSYDGSGDDTAAAIALGQDGDGYTTVHVTGTSFNTVDNDYVTVKYLTTWPDLTISAVDGPATAFNGADISVSNTVLNVNDPAAGKNQAAGAFSVGLYLAPDVSGSPNLSALIFLGSRSVSSLTSGATSSASTTVTIPDGSTAPGGSYFLVAVADSGATVAEKLEDNNVTASGSAITISDGPDLVANSTSGPASGNAGSNISVSYSILNSRSPAAGTFDIDFVMSGDNIIGNGDDVALPMVSGGTIGGITGNGSASGSATVTIPNTVGSGNYYVGLIVDSGDAVAETREDNNTVASTGTVSVSGLPDLTVTAVSGPLGGTAGQTITVSNTVHSSGNVGGFQVDIYLSTDTTIDSGTDTFLGSRSLGSLAAGASNTDNTVVTLPGGTAQGVYYLGVIVDSTDSVVEGNETNNTLSSAIAANDANGSFSGGIVTVGDTAGGDDVDLAISNVTGPGTAVRGSTISVDTTVENTLATAAGSFDVGIYLSPDATITTDDVLLGTRTVTSLGGNSSDTASTTVTVPIDLASPDVKGLWHMNALSAASLPPNTVDNGNGTWTTTLQPDGVDGIDTYVQSKGAGNTDTSNVNYGSATNFRFNYYSSYNSEVLLQFDLSALPIGTLNSANLAITTGSTTGTVTMTYRVGKLTSAWNESTVTWNNKPARTGNYASTNVPINGVATWNVTSLVDEWLTGVSTNYGLSLYRASSTSNSSNSNWYRLGYSSDFATAGSRPKLALTYVPKLGVADYSANGNAGNLFGGVSLTSSGQYNSALSFDGSSGYVIAPDNGVSLSSPFTLEAWVNPTVNTGSQVIVGKEDSYLMSVRSGTLQYAIKTAGTWTYVDTGLAVAAGSWSHVAITYDGTTVIGYVNGVADSTPDVDPDGGPVDQNGNSICIGNRGATCTGAEYFNGAIDEVALYGVALSAADISQHYSSTIEGAAWNRAYYLGAIADTGSVVTELNENNNAAVQVAAGSPGAISVSAVVAGDRSAASSGGGGSLGWMDLLILFSVLFGLRCAAGMNGRRVVYQTAGPAI